MWIKNTSTKANAVAKFREGRGIRPGDDIVVVGFPLHGLLTSDPSVTTGNVSALAGPGDDRRYLQITAPVQQGNSGLKFDSEAVLETPWPRRASHPMPRNAFRSAP